MLSKPKKSKAISKHAAPVRKADVKRRTLKLSPEISREEVETLAAQIERHEQSEKAWQRLASTGEGDDKWSAVEEHLLNKSQQSHHAERRWKYFAK